MIFKTFQTDLDGISNKIGFSKRGFAEWGKQVSNSFKESEGVINSFKNALKTAFTVPEEKDNSWIKNKLGEIVDKNNINSYIPELTGKKASDLAQRIREQSVAVADATDGWEDYFTELKNNGQGYIEDLIKNTDDLSKLTGEDLVKANQQARASALAHNEAIKAQTFSAKAGKVALQALVTAGNMIAGWAITKGLELAIKGIDNLIHSAEYCKERVDEVMSSYQSTTSSLRENAKEISSLSSRYDQLSKGVGNLGNNISLTEDEFEEYHNITSKIAEMYPDLVDGWDAQGNAIVNLTDSVKELNSEYEKSLHNANLTLMESKDDIFKNYENTVNDITKQIEYAEKAMDIVQSKGSFYDVIYDSEGHKTSYYKAFENLGLSVDDMINGNFNTLERQLILKIQSLKDEMDKAAQDVTPLLNAYLSEDVDYQNISDEKLKTALSTFISSLPESLVTDITENGASAGSNFVEGLVDVVKDDDSVQNALMQLLSLDTEELSYKESNEIIDNYISIIVNALNSIGYDIDPIELQVELGLDIKNVKEDLRTRLSNGTQDLVIDDWVASLTEEEAKFANSTAFDKALERQKDGLNGTALSAENYSAALEEVKASQDGIGNKTPVSSLSISQTIDQLNTQLKPAFDSLNSAWNDIFTDDEFKLNSIDILSTCDSIKSKLDEMSELGLDVDYSAFENFVRVLNDSESDTYAVDKAFDSLANSIAQAALTGAEDFRTMKAALEDLGVVNSDIIAFQSLINNTTALEEAVTQAGLTMADFVVHTEDGSIAATDAAQAFIKEMVGAENCQQALALLQLQQVLCNENSLNTTDDINACLTLANAAGVAVEALSWLANVSAQYDAAVAAGDTVAQKNLSATMASIKAKINAEISNFQPVAVDFSGVGKNAKSAGSKAGKDYKDGLKEALSDLDSVISGITGKIDDNIEAVRTQKEEAVAAIDAQIDALNEQKSALEDQKKALEEERDARIEIIEQQKKQLELAIKAIDKQIKQKEKVIKGIQDEIKAMKDANEQRKLQLNLQREQYELERLQQQRTILQYSSEKGMHFVQDTKGIRDQKEKVDDVKLEIEIANKQKQIDLIEKEIDLLNEKKDAINEQIELLDEQIDQINEFYDQQIKAIDKQIESIDKQIEALQKQKEETEKYYESMIEGMEKSKSKYEELTELVGKAELSAKLKQLGIDEEALLNGSEEEFEKLKNAYMNIVFQLNEGNDDVLSALRELSGYEGTAPSMLEDSNTKLDTMNENLTTSNTNVGNVNSSLDKTATTTGTVASNVSDLSSNLDAVNGSITAEQTVFEGLKSIIDEVIAAINLKIEAINAENTAVATATGTEIANFQLLINKILEVKEKLDEINTTVATMDRQPIDNLANAFQLLYDKILLVSNLLDVGVEGAGEGAVSGISGAIQALNEISLEEGIIAQFTNLKEAIDSVTAAISGGGGESSEGDGSGGGSGKGGKSGDTSSEGESGGSGNSLTGAIKEMGETAKEVIGESDAEGDGTVIGEFGSMETAVNDVRDAIGTVSSEGGEGGSGGETDDTLVGSIKYLGDKTEEEMGESGGDGIIGRFEEFRDVIGEADGHVKSISEGLDNIDGKTVECTIKMVLVSKWVGRAI